MVNPVRRVGLLDRYLLRLLVPGFVLGAGVFLFALLLQELIRNLQILVTQAASPAVVGQALLLLVPGLLVVAIPSALLLGILLALNRLAAGRELIAMRAGGISPSRLLRPIAAASLIAAAVSAFLMIGVVPETNRRFVELRDGLLNARLRTEIRPRIFYDELLDDQVLLIGEILSDGSDWEEVFLAETDTAARGNPEARIAADDITGGGIQPGDPTLVVAARGRLVTVPEDRVAFLDLRSVEVHNGRPADPGRYRIQRAAEHRLPLDADDVFGRETMSPRQDARAMTLEALQTALEETGAPVYRVEIHKKFALPAACLVLGLIGVGLGLRPGAGPERSGAFAVAVLVVLAYHVPLAFGEELAASGELSPWLSMWAPNLLVLFGGGALLVFASREMDPLAPLFRLVGKIRMLPGRLGGGRLGASRPARRRRRRYRPFLLDRYVAVRFVGYLAVALAGLVAAQLIGRLTAVVGDALDNGVSLLEVGRYLGLSVPAFTAEMIPLAALAATLITYGVLRRHLEVTAFLAGGVSRGRLAVPALAVGLLASAAGFGIQEFVIPWSGPAADDLGARIRGRQLRHLNPLERHWGIGEDGAIYHYDAFDAKNGVVEGLSVFFPAADGASLAARTFAASAHWSETERVWTGIGGFRREFSAGAEPEPFAVRRLAGLGPPEELLSEEQVPEHLRYLDLRAQVAAVESAGHQTTELRVDLHTRASLPLAAVVTVLIGVPFAFGSGASSGAASAGTALGIAIVYLLAAPFFEFLGDSRLLEPALAAWSPNLLFSLASAVLLFRTPQ